MRMQVRGWSLFLVFLLLIPLIPLMHGNDEIMEDEDVFWTSEEASVNWILGATPILQTSPLRSTSGLLHPVTGSFDPLLTSPMLSAGLHDNLDVIRTGMLIVQDVDADRTDLENWLR